MANIEALRRSFEIGRHGLREVAREVSEAAGYVVERVIPKVPSADSFVISAGR